MGYFQHNEKTIPRLHELADLQHPHMKGDNHTRTLINKVFNAEKLSTEEAFDCGKYYQRMLNQINNMDISAAVHSEYLHAVLEFKWTVK